MNQEETADCLTARVKEKIRVMKSHIEREIIREVPKHIRGGKEKAASLQATRQGDEQAQDFQGKSNLHQG